MAVPITDAMQTSIANLYIAILGRNPEPAGFGAWVSAYANAGATPAALDVITLQFSTSPEFIATYDGLTTAAAVTTMYSNILERAPDAEGLAAWSSLADFYINFGLEVGEAYALVANQFIVSAAANTGTADSTLILGKEATAVAAGTATPTTTYTLTTNIDTIDVVGSGANNVNSGLMSQTAGESTLNTGDTINGNGLTTVSLIVDAGAVAVQPIADINNVASINVNLATSTSEADGILNMAEFVGVAQVAITQGTNAQVLGVASAQVDTTYAINIARTVTLDITGFEDATGDADTITFAANGAGTADATRATFDLSGEAIETVAVTTTGTNFVNINGGALVDTYTVSGTGTSDITIAAAAANMTVDASGNSGTNVFRIGSLLSSLDTITGGSGTDTLRAVANTGTTRATISAVETLRFDFDNAGATQDLRNVTGATTLTLEGAQTATATRAAATIATVNLVTQTAGAAASVTYASGSDAATALNIGTTNTAGDAVVALGTVAVAGNTGALIINSVGNDDNTAGNITANDTTSLTINAATVGLSLGANDISASDATTFTVNASGADITFDDSTLTAATAINLNATGGAISAGNFTTAADAAEITVVASGGNANDLAIALVDADYATSFSFAATGGSDITVTDIETLGEDSDGADINNQISLSALGSGTTVAVTIDAFANAGIVDLVTVTTDADGVATFTIGTGTNVTISEVDATASAGTTSIDLSGVAVASEVSTGAGDATVIMTSAADTFVGGAGDDTVTGGAAADDITLGGGHDTMIITTNATTDTVGDFVAGATTVTSSDNIAIDLSAINAILDVLTAGAVVITGDGTAVADGETVVVQAIQANAGVGEALGATTNVVYVEGTFATLAAFQTAIEDGGTNEITLTNTADDGFMAFYQDTAGNTQVVLVTVDEVNAGATISAGKAVGAQVATLVGVDVADVVAANYSFIA